MICVLLLGGLGNQMFQYAFMRHIEEMKFKDVALDLHGFRLTENAAKENPIVSIRHFMLDKFQTRYRIFDSNGNSPCSRIVNDTEDYSDLELMSGDVYLVGYWQNLKYFTYIHDSLKKECRLKPEYVTDDMLALQEQMDACTSVSIHVRRTDYLLDFTQNIYPLCTTEYYEKAIDRIAYYTDSDPVLFVFSDDLPWCREHMDNFHGYKTVFVDTGTAYQDLHLMSRTKHNIIVNSTFSWWGAYLNTHDDHITIAPAKWYTSKPNPNLYPADWITI